ncbi:MAG: MarR family transcriptional regulator [Arenicellales bacterium]
MSTSTPVAAIRAFNRFYTNVIGVVDRHVLDSPFSLTEVRILWEIHHDDGCNPRKIREALRVDEGYLSRTISRLVGRDLVHKRRSSTDARKFALSLTDLGRKTFLELDRKAGAAIESLIDPLSDDEVDEVVVHMDRIRELLRREDSLEATA